MNREVNYKNVKYGMLVEVLRSDGGHHAGCKVHFFNHKGVLVGQLYEFLPYKQLRLREPHEDQDRTYPRYFYEKRFERVRCWLLIRVCNVVTFLIKFTQKYMHEW